MNGGCQVSTTVPEEIGDQLTALAREQYIKRAALVRQILIREVLKRREEAPIDEIKPPGELEAAG